MAINFKKIAIALLIFGLLYESIVNGLIYALLLTVLLLLGMNYISTGCNIMNPGNVICVSFLFSILCAMMNIEKWAIDISLKTYLYIMIGLLSYIIPGIIIYSFFGDKDSYSRYKKITCLNYFTKELNIDIYQPNSKLKIDKKIIFIIAIFDVFTLLLFLLDIIRISGVGNLTQVMYAYRHARGNRSVSIITNQCLRILVAFSYVSLYAFIYNVYYRKNGIKRNLIFLIPVVFHLIKAFLSSGRYEFLILFIYSISVVTFLYYYKYQIHFTLKRETIIILLISLSLLVFLFYEIRSLMGRDTYNEDIITYFTAYFGGSIQLLDQYLDTYNGPTSSVFGATTFGSVFKYIIKFLKVNIELGTTSEFRRSSTGILIGNVYTTFRNYLQDFGIVGLIFCPIIGSIVWNFFYYFTLKKGSHYSRIVYSYLLYAQVLSSYSEQFFTVYLSIDIIMITIMIYVAYLFLSRIKIKVWE